jgi:hypothetical protein
MESQKMELSAITFMLAEAILGKVGAEVTHHSVPRDFCDYTGGGDGKAQAVAIDNGGLWKGKGNYRQAVNQHVVGHAGQRGDGGPHRFVCGAQDIDAVDFNRIDNAHRPAQVGV